MSNNNSFLISESMRITRNNSAINMPSRMQPMPENRSVLQHRDRISHSPGINVTQVQRERTNELQQKESIYINHNHPPYERLHIITNLASGPNQHQNKNRNDRSFDHSMNPSGFDSGHPSVLQRPERTLQFKEKAMAQQPKQLLSPHPPHKTFHFDPNAEKQQAMTPTSKLKPYRSIQHKEMVESKYFANPN